MVSTNLALLGALWLGLVDSSKITLEVEPKQAQLRGSDSLVQVAVTGRAVDGKPTDLTPSAKYSSRDSRASPRSMAMA